jgi:competence protein ComEC
MSIAIIVSFMAVPFSSYASTSSHLSTYHLTASLNNTHPKEYSTIYLTVRGIPSGTFKSVFHYRTKDTYYSGRIGQAFPVRISRATKSFRVVVNITATYKGKTYRTETSFSPR